MELRTERLDLHVSRMWEMGFRFRQPLFYVCGLKKTVPNEIFLETFTELD